MNLLLLKPSQKDILLFIRDILRKNVELHNTQTLREMSENLFFFNLK